MIVNSHQLDSMAAALRRSKRGTYLFNSHWVTPAQFAAAAKLLREADPSVCNRDVQERPGFIEPGHQTERGVLVLQIGILPSTTYRIHQRGRVEDAA